MKLYEIEIARTAQQKAYGLMFQKRLGADHGMLFLFDKPKVERFWMKNTLIPLDLIFIDRDGRIIKIATKAKPHDLTEISSDKPVRAVLEIAGGQAERDGIRLKDKVLIDSVFVSD